MAAWLIRGAALIALGIAAAAGAGAGAGAAQDKVRISFNPQIYSYLPVFVAIDKGFFKEQNIELDIVTYPGSALTQIPMLARGDQDIAGMVTGPAFFNQHAEGFGIKLVASLAQSKPGWHDTMWVMIRKDVWDAGKIKSFADFKGTAIEGGPKGSPIYLVMRQVLEQGGISLADVTFSERLRGVADSLPLFRNKVVDAMAMVEPIASRLESEGLAMRWKPAHEVIPWFQEAYLAASPKFLAEKRDVTKRFLKAFLKGAQAVTASGGKWTPELRDSVTKWSKLPPELFDKMAGPQHAGQLGLIDIAAVGRLQDIWIKEGVVKEKTPLASLVDTTMVDAARKEMGIQ